MSLSREDQILKREAEQAVTWGRETIAMIARKEKAVGDAVSRELSESATTEISDSHDAGLVNRRVDFHGDTNSTLGRDGQVEGKPLRQAAIDEVDTEIADATAREAARLQAIEDAENER